MSFPNGCFQCPCPQNELQLPPASLGDSVRSAGGPDPGSLFYLILSYLILSYLILYIWLHWIFVAARGLSQLAASGGYSSLRCVGYSVRWLLLLQSTGSSNPGSVAAARRLASCSTWALEPAGSVVVAHGLSFSAACGIFLDQGLNPCPLHWQADS